MMNYPRPGRTTRSRKSDTFVSKTSWGGTLSVSSVQRGNTLVVGLILLFVMALLALSSMTGVVTQERIAGNSNFKGQAEQAAMSAAAAFKNDFDNCEIAAVNQVEKAINAGVGAPPLGPLVITIPNNGTHKGEIWVTLRQRVSDTASSLNHDQTTGSVGNYHLEIIARGTNNSNTAVTAKVRKGFQINSSCRNS